MTKGGATALAVGIGVVAVGGGVYLYAAHKNGWWPFKKEETAGGGGGTTTTGGGGTTTSGGPPSPPGQPTVSQPTVTGPNTAEVTVSWDAVDGATYYRVFVNDRPAADNVQGTSVKLTDLVPGQTYRIAVAACN